MRSVFSILFMLIMSNSQAACADQFNLPVSTNTNTNPFVNIHGLVGFSGVDQVASGEISTRVNIDITNEFHQKTNANEQLSLDYERTTLDFNFNYGLNNRFAIGMNVPYVMNSGGFLDNLIENWHDLFGLDQGGRGNAGRNQFLIAYKTGDQSLLLDRSSQGFGDISVYLDTPVVNTQSQKIKARASLKFPTAKAQRLFGNGGYTLSFNLNAAALLSPGWTGYAGAGVNFLGEGDILSSQQKNRVASATLGLGWQLTPNMLLSAQLDLNTKVFEGSDLDAITGQAGVLLLSAQYEFSNQSVVQIGFTEDVINKDAAPDFGLRFGFKF